MISIKTANTWEETKPATRFATVSSIPLPFTISSFVNCQTDDSTHFKLDIISGKTSSFLSVYGGCVLIQSHRMIVRNRTQKNMKSAPTTWATSVPV